MSVSPMTSLLPISEFILYPHLSSSICHGGHSFILKTLFYLASKTFLFQLFSYLCWLFIFPISGMPLDYHHTSILLYLLSFPKKSHLFQDVKFSYMLINPKWISSAPTSPLNFKIHFIALIKWIKRWIERPPAD